MLKKVTIILIFIFFYDMKVFANTIHNTELWLHRGQNYSNNIEDVFLKIDDQSWNGVEIDIFFSKQHNKFFITHDLPLNNSLQTLKDIFLINNKKIWLDFKNLSDIPFSNLLKLRENLKHIGYKNEIFIESQNFFKLKFLQSEKVNIIFNIPIVFKNKIYLSLMSYLTNFLNFEYVSVSIDSFHIIQKYFKSNQIFLFTVNSQKKICELVSKNYAFVVLTSVGPKEIDCLKE